MKKFKSVDPYSLGIDPIRRIGKEWMLVSSGESGSWNTMTASWGGLGELWSKPVAFVFVRPSRYTYSFMEKQTRFSLSFFPPSMRAALELCGKRSGRDIDKAKEAGLTPFFHEGGGLGFEEADTVLICDKLYSDAIETSHFHKSEIIPSAYPSGDYHKVYVGAIVDCLCR